jgi:hypothetical protein
MLQKLMSAKIKEERKQYKQAHARSELTAAANPAAPAAAAALNESKNLYVLLSHYIHTGHTSGAQNHVEFLQLKNTTHLSEVMPFQIAVRQRASKTTSKDINILKQASQLELTPKIVGIFHVVQKNHYTRGASGEECQIVPENASLLKGQMFLPIGSSHTHTCLQDKKGNTFVQSNDVRTVIVQTKFTGDLRDLFSSGHSVDVDAVGALITNLFRKAAEAGFFHGDLKLKNLTYMEMGENIYDVRMIDIDDKHCAILTVSKATKAGLMWLMKTCLLLFMRTYLSDVENVTDIKENLGNKMISDLLVKYLLMDYGKSPITERIDSELWVRVKLFCNMYADRDLMNVLLQVSTDQVRYLHAMHEYASTGRITPESLPSSLSASRSRR